MALRYLSTKGPVRPNGSSAEVVDARRVSKSSTVRATRSRKWRRPRDRRMPGALGWCQIGPREDVPCGPTSAPPTVPSDQDDRSAAAGTASPAPSPPATSPGDGIRDLVGQRADGAVFTYANKQGSWGPARNILNGTQTLMLMA